MLGLLRATTLAAVFVHGLAAANPATLPVDEGVTGIDPYGVYWLHGIPVMQVDADREIPATMPKPKLEQWVEEKQRALREDPIKTAQTLKPRETTVELVWPAQLTPLDFWSRYNSANDTPALSTQDRTAWMSYSTPKHYGSYPAILALLDLHIPNRPAALPVPQGMHQWEMSYDKGSLSRREYRALHRAVQEGRLLRVRNHWPIMSGQQASRAIFQDLKNKVPAGAILYSEWTDTQRGHTSIEAGGSYVWFNPRDSRGASQALARVLQSIEEGDVLMVHVVGGNSHEQHAAQDEWMAFLASPAMRVPNLALKGERTAGPALHDIVIEIVRP